MAEDKATTKVVVVGAGPVGALAALYAARRGWHVSVYELRDDLRHDSTTPLGFTKSINLALSERGIHAMRHSGSPHLVETILAETIPMYGRMIHGRDSSGRLTEEPQAYDVHGRFIRAVDRARLNRLLLDELDGLPNVDLHFRHKLTGADLRKRKAWFEQKPVAADSSSTVDRARELEVDFDLILGCDGAHSSVRYHLMKYVRMDYEQSYIDTLWCEFTIPPATSSSTDPASSSAKDGFATSPSHLHIWPGTSHMFIAIPSLDRSFTCTLFAPESTFTSLSNDPSTLPAYFESSFPGAATLIGGSTALQQQFARNPHLPLISIKCAPHTFGSSAVILGDAAHAMVPFYGQGMNAGLEDVRVLFEHLDAAGGTTAPERAAALQAYTTQRAPDAHAICDLAAANYWEMHAGVRSPVYRLRKWVEEFLADTFPSTGWATQYARVSFGNQRYSEVVRVVGRQGRTLVWGGVGMAVLGTVLSGWMGRWILMRRLRRGGDVIGGWAALKEMLRRMGLWAR